jgi:hypothetical protein
MMQINHIVFLIHPLVYEPMTPEQIHERNLTIFYDREQEIKQRWLKEAESLRSTLVAQLYGSKELVQGLSERMGAKWVCYAHGEYTEGMPQLEYDTRLVQSIRDHTAEHQLTLDPETVTSEIWGESFEGCAPDYASSFAVLLGLKKPPKMRFEMTMHDSRFIKGAKVVEIIAIPNSDVEAVVFELYDETFAAIYQARLTPQRVDDRMITVNLDPTRTQVCTKLNHTIWPTKVWQKGDPSVSVPVQFKTRDYYWVRSLAISYEGFREMIAGAVVAENA